MIKFIKSEPVAFFGGLQAILMAMLGTATAFTNWSPTSDQIGAVTGLYAAATAFVTFLVRQSVTPYPGGPLTPIPVTPSPPVPEAREFDLEEASRLRKAGIIDERTMIPAGLVPPTENDPFWEEIARRLDKKQPLDAATWSMIERAIHPTHPAWDDLSSHLLEREGWVIAHAEWARLAGLPKPPGRVQHGEGYE